MRMFFGVLLLWPVTLLAQSPFEGTWVANLNSVHFPKRSEVYSLRNGAYECTSCVPKIRVKADGQDYPVAGSPYFSTLGVRVIDSTSIQVTEKQGARIVYSEIDTVSPDGNTLTQRITDSAPPSGQPISAEETYKRVSQGPAGSVPISGSWQAERANGISENGITVTYHSTPDGLQASNLNGEGYDAKFDGKEYPIQGDPAHGTVSLKSIHSNTILETDKEDGEVHYKLLIAVSPDGQSMKVTEIDKERGIRTTYTMEKQSR